MNLVSVKTFALLTSLWAIGNASAACPSDDPVAIAKSFYAKHAAFSSEDPAKIKSIVTQRFFEILAKEYKCAQGQICAIEADVWTDAQDGRIGKPIDFATASNTGVEATVVMTYPFILNKTPKQQHAKLIFQRASATECWLLNDLVGPDGDSLVKTLEDWYKQYGDAL